jgi:hypothetical protein
MRLQFASTCHDQHLTLNQQNNIQYKGPHLSSQSSCPLEFTCHRTLGENIPTARKASNVAKWYNKYQSTEVSTFFFTYSFFLIFLSYISVF